MLIARIYPLMTVYTVRGGQRKGSKHVINFLQNVSRLATTLPQKPEDIPLIVRRANQTEDKHYDFRVRRGKVQTEHYSGLKEIINGIEILQYQMRPFRNYRST